MKTLYFISFVVKEKVRYILNDIIKIYKKLDCDWRNSEYRNHQVNIWCSCIKEFLVDICRVMIKLKRELRERDNLNIGLTLRFVWKCNYLESDVGRDQNFFSTFNEGKEISN